MEENLLPAVPCKRCDMDELLSIEQIRAQIPEYIKAIGEDIRVPDGEYRSRLDICYKCEGLAFGITCKYCGCFVQMRAVNKHRHCPHPSGKLW